MKQIPDWKKLRWEYLRDKSGGSEGRVVAGEPGMKRRMMRHNKIALITLFLLAMTVVMMRQVRQDKLNRALIGAVVENNVQQVRSLLQQGALPNADVLDDPLSDNHPSVWERLLDLLRRRHHDTVLIQVIGMGEEHSPVIEALLDAGADPNATGAYSTPLGLAMYKHQWKTLQALFRHHVDVNLQYPDGITRLMVAASWTDTKMVETLLEQGAKPDVKDDAGHTALWFSMGRSAFSWHDASPVDVSDASIRATMACLLRHGASVNVVDNDHRTPLSYAQEYHDPQLIRMLKQYGAKK
jgi:hypothetical protein